MTSHVTEFIARRWSLPRGRLDVALKPLSGGLESVVSRATIEPAGEHAREVPPFVVKELRGKHRREAGVYEALWMHLEHPPTARVLGVACSGGTHYLYLEDVLPTCAWPWRHTPTAADVCRALARLHDTPALLASVREWDYETELVRSAGTTLATALAARTGLGVRHWRRVGDLKRVVGSLPAVRARLLEGDVTMIHGDVHPGNVIIRSGRPGHRVALIDWGRARVGSPLEDVASWLHSLGCWEPEARRKHDTLLRAYLESRKVRRGMTAGLRANYWFASASNGLSGAIRYHLAVLMDLTSTDEMRWHSRRALHAWGRVIRRAAALLTPSRGC
jgi:hypothetical protein